MYKNSCINAKISISMQAYKTIVIINTCVCFLFDFNVNANKKTLYE